MTWREPVFAQALDLAVLTDCQPLEKLLQFADDAVRHLNRVFANCDPNPYLNPNNHSPSPNHKPGTLTL